jgi:uncharacterized protein YdeI (YjbR/CyaY-like superfamily)
MPSRFRSAHRFSASARRARSRWSRINRDKVERLIADGRMRAAGLTEVERAQADGRWEAAYDGQKTIAVPDDLRRELDACPRAKAFFAELTSQNRYAILYGSKTQRGRRPALDGWRSSSPCSTPARRSTRSDRGAHS